MAKEKGCILQLKALIDEKFENRRSAFLRRLSSSLSAVVLSLADGGGSAGVPVMSAKRVM